MRNAIIIFQKVATSSSSNFPAHLVVVRKLDLLEDGLLGRLLDLSGHDQLVKDEVGLLKVEDDVQLAHGAKVLVQHLHVPVDQLEGQQLVVVLKVPIFFLAFSARLMYGLTLSIAKQKKSEAYRL